MPLTREQVEHVARLAHLSLTAEEAEGFTHQLSQILDYLDKLQELDVEGVEPTAWVEVESTPLREDEPLPSLSVDEALANAPAREGNFFSVPRILE